MCDRETKTLRRTPLGHVGAPRRLRTPDQVQRPPRPSRLSHGVLSQQGRDDRRLLLEPMPSRTRKRSHWSDGRVGHRRHGRLPRTVGVRTQDPRLRCIARLLLIRRLPIERGKRQPRVGALARIRAQSELAACRRADGDVSPRAVSGGLPRSRRRGGTDHRGRGPRAETVGLCALPGRRSTRDRQRRRWRPRPRSRQPRTPRRGAQYPVDEKALQHGAGVEVETSESKEAYARFSKLEASMPREEFLPG